MVYAGAFMSDASFKGANLQEAVFTKAYSVNSNYEGADISNAIIDRTNFTGSNFTGAVRACGSISRVPPRPRLRRKG